MKVDPCGIVHFESSEVCDLLYLNPGLNMSEVRVNDPDQYIDSVKTTYAGFDIPTKYELADIDIDEFDSINQSNWYMPDEYQQLDIAKWVLDQCSNEAELQRAGQELLLYQERDLFDLLRYIKFLVDTLRKNNIVWGVGRGSSVASFVLYKIGIHRINSLYYDLPIEEFLK